MANIQMTASEKSPMDYFEAQNFEVNQPANKEITSAEKIFMQKYMGVDSAEALTSIVQVKSDGKSKSFVQQQNQQIPQGFDSEFDLTQESLDEKLKTAEEVLFVGLYLHDQLFTIPIMAVQEVVPYIPPSRLPMAPSFVMGVVNFWDHITPIIRLSDFLCLPGKEHPKGTGLFIICSFAGLQIGLYIDKIHTMYRAIQTDLKWDVETQLGSSAEFISGLLVNESKLLGIVSVERIVKFLISTNNED